MLRSMILRNHGFQLSGELSAENRQIFDSITSQPDAGHPRKFSLWKRIAEALGLALLLFCLLVTLRVVFLIFPQMWSGHSATSFLYTLRDLWQLVLLLGVFGFILLHIGKSALRPYVPSIKKRDRILIIGLLFLSVLVNPFISAPLDKVQLFTASLIPVTAALLLFWLLVLAFAVCYQIEYKKIFHKYFTGRDLWKK